MARTVVRARVWCYASRHRPRPPHPLGKVYARPQLAPTSHAGAQGGFALSAEAILLCSPAPGFAQRRAAAGRRCSRGVARDKKEGSVCCRATAARSRCA